MNEDAFLEMEYEDRSAPPVEPYYPGEYDEPSDNYYPPFDYDDDDPSPYSGTYSEE